MSPYMIIFIVNDDNYVLLGGNSWQLLGIGKNSIIFCGSALERDLVDFPADPNLQAASSANLP